MIRYIIHVIFSFLGITCLTRVSVSDIEGTMKETGVLVQEISKIRTESREIYNPNISIRQLAGPCRAVTVSMAKLKSTDGEQLSKRSAKAGSDEVFSAGACAVDVTPLKFPVIVNGMFEERTANGAHDRLHARCLVLDDGTSRAAIVVVDSCMLPRDLLDQAKGLAHRMTSIPTDHMLISATHTHSAPSAMGALGSSPDEEYRRFLVPRIAQAIQSATQNLRPARVGWAVATDFQHTHCRRWILRPDRIRRDPFGRLTVRATMHPGYQNPDFIGPSGPVDPDLSVVAVQSLEGRPIALLANYSMHYFGAPILSADYYGRFPEKVGGLIGADTGDPPFVAIMSQGTSGDLMWMDYSRPKEQIDIDAYAEAVAQVAHGAYQKIQYHDWVPLAMRETRLKLRRRLHDGQRLAWAKPIVASMAGRKPHSLQEIYAHEQVLLSQEPTRELKLQALRLGEVGITAMPNEVFGLTGLKIKAQSPLQPTFNIELANGSEGYIPPPEQHALGGYTTWEARTAGLEVRAEPKIVDAVLGLLEGVSGEPRREVTDTHGTYARDVLASKPLAYWRMNEMSGPAAADATGNGHPGVYEDGIAFYLQGPQAPQFSGEGAINRSAHFAGGRLKAAAKELGSTYTVELWFWNGLPNDARAVTGYLFSRGSAEGPEAAGDHLGIGGTQSASGRLVFAGGDKRDQALAGHTGIDPQAWYHVVLVRDGKQVAVYLNGNTEPEISGEGEVGDPSGAGQLFIGGRSDDFADFEGKIDEVAIYSRALTPSEVAAHWKASGLPSGSAKLSPKRAVNQIEFDGVPQVMPVHLKSVLDLRDFFHGGLQNKG
jgi:Concanavalin A-like lectin/glucanases superfamily/Neutral/alkaline non-lysosomal ceramidase, N-terminal